MTMITVLGAAAATACSSGGSSASNQSDAGHMIASGATGSELDTGLPPGSRAAGGNAGRESGGSGGTSSASDSGGTTSLRGSGGAPDSGGTAGNASAGASGGESGPGRTLGNGGTPGSGGTLGSGGTPGSGGTVNSGGKSGSGGAPSSGGKSGSGGKSSSGGAPSNGGKSGSGGTPSNGGKSGSGGAPSNGGTPGSGGTVSTGGAPGNGGTVSTGGAPGAGGTVSTGGTSGAGGSVSAPPQFPLKASANGRYLVDANGTPFPVLGDAGWYAVFNIDAPSRGTYLDDRVKLGFNAVLFTAIEHEFMLNKPPRNFTNDLPFSKRLDGNAYTGSPNGTTDANGNSGQYQPDPYSDINSESPDFTSPNETYWATIDAYIALCAEKGIVVFMWPSYVGYGGTSQGWMSEMVVNDAVTGSGSFDGQPWADASKSKLWNYGAWIANRYKNTPNVIWLYGGDYGNDPNNGGVFTTAQKNAENDLLAGNFSISGQASTLRLAHWSRPSLTTDISFTAGSFNLEGVYSNTAAAQIARSGYAHSPALPAIEIENYYENDSHDDGQPQRRFQWWTELSAIGGLFFGNNLLWPFTSDWQSNLDSPGAEDMARLNAFVRSIAWYKLVPSGLNGMKTLITAGGGTDNPQSTDYVSAAADPNGSLLVAYVPPSHSGSITLDMSALGGTARARWYNPATAAYNAIATGLSNQGTHAFTPPGDNGSGFTDWVLVVDAN